MQLIDISTHCLLCYKFKVDEDYINNAITSLFVVILVFRIVSILRFQRSESTVYVKCLILCIDKQMLALILIRNNCCI